MERTQAQALWKWISCHQIFSSAHALQPSNSTFRTLSKGNNQTLSNIYAPNYKSNLKFPNKGQVIKLWRIQIMFNEAAIAYEAHKSDQGGTSLVVQWLRFHAPNTEGPGSIPGQGTRPHVLSKSSWAQINNFFFKKRVTWGDKQHLEKAGYETVICNINSLHLSTICLSTQIHRRKSE